MEKDFRGWLLAMRTRALRFRRLVRCEMSVLPFVEVLSAKDSILERAVVRLPCLRRSSIWRKERTEARSASGAPWPYSWVAMSEAVERSERWMRRRSWSRLE